jgi:lipopolysaccharide biosynthesis glycosyltransferase
MPVSTYFKISLADLLPATVDRAVWLDCDLVVIDDIGNLWDSDLGGRHLAAVQDAVVPRVSSRCGVEHHARLGMSADAMYFNAGVMLVDVTLWRRDRVSDDAIDYLRTYARSVVFWDQEGLNVALYGKWLPLDGRWNVNASLPGSRSTGAKRPAIVHYAGNLKPWRFRTRNRLRALYFDYLDRTAYAGWRPQPSAAATMISLYESSRLRSLLYPAENVGMRLVRRLTSRH